MILRKNMHTAAAFLAGLVVCCPLAAQQDDGVVQGIVRDTVSRLGVPGAQVTLFGPALSGPRVATSDATGRFRFDALKHAVYGTRAEKEGYYTVNADNARPVTAGANPTEVEQELAPWARLSGRVVDPDGNPLASVRVVLSPLPLYGGTVDGKDPNTDSDGRFEFAKLMPGTYTLRAIPPREWEPITAPASDAPRQRVVLTYYPAETDSTRAERITVGAGANQPLIDLRLQRSPVYRVRGTVLNPEGRPVPGIDVSLSHVEGRFAFVFGRQNQMFFRPGDSMEPTEPQRASTDAEGHFEFPSVVEGDWLVESIQEGQSSRPDRGSSLRAAERVRISRRDEEKLELRLQPPFTVPVTVDFGDDAPAGPTVSPSPGAVVQLEAIDGRPAPPAEAGVQRDGEIRGLYPGRYMAYTAPIGGFYVAAVRLGPADVTGQPFTLTGAGPQLQIVMKRGGGRVIGSIEDGRAGLVLVWPDQRDPGLMPGAKVEPGANFEIGSLKPGSYLAIALNRTDTRGLTANQIENLRNSANRFTVSEGSTATVRLSLK